MVCRKIAWFLLFVLTPAAAWAGMPSLVVDSRTAWTFVAEPTARRLEAISFFAVIALLAALGVQLLWNVLRRDFPKLPRMSFGRAVGVVALWGLLALVVLTMIAGARETMTPGAWRKKGMLYELTAPPPTVSPAKPTEHEP